MKRALISISIAALVSLSACGAEQEAEVGSEGEFAGERAIEGEGQEGAVLGEGGVGEGIAREGEGIAREGEAAVEGALAEGEGAIEGE